MEQPTNQEQLRFSFGEAFMSQHAGRLLSDPLSALVELVANAWDAGATSVHLTIPLGEGKLEIRDNGIGMHDEEFRHRWLKLSYERLKEQGSKVLFPPGSTSSFRVPFGRNGIGRHAMFCFNDRYDIATSAGKERVTYEVRRSSGERPFTLTFLDRKASSEYGTCISTNIVRNFVDPKTIGSSIGERFVSDPNFTVWVNAEKIQFERLQDEDAGTALGSYIIHRIGGDRSANTKYHGIAWWVNGRLVGSPSWDGLEGRLLDGRASLAKRYTYIVVADELARHVKQDWSGFHAHPEVQEARKEISNWVADDLLVLSAGTRGERKRSALRANADIIRTLPRINRAQIESFIDEVQKSCPTIGERELENTARVFAMMEKTRTGYSLLEKLSRLSTNDLDDLTLILGEWTASDAKKVLDELSFRLRLLESLEDLVENSATDELHDLQPLFEKGLWIFGPEFESLSFISNRTLSTVIKTYFGSADLSTPSRRPDFVILPESSIGVYASDAFDDSHEVTGFEKIVIVELKRGGFRLTREEKIQALQYSGELRKSGRVGPNTPIECFVLGSTIEQGAADEMVEGRTVIRPLTYERIVKRAHARTFNLLNTIESLRPLQLIQDDSLFEEPVDLEFGAIESVAAEE